MTKTDATLAPKFVNLTGRDLTVYSGKDDQEGQLIPAVPGQKVSYKGITDRGQSLAVNGLPVACSPASAPSAKAEDIEGLPQPERGVIYVVPFPVAGPAYALGRRDILSMGNARIKDGTQTGAEGFIYPGPSSELEALLADAAQE